MTKIAQWIYLIFFTILPLLFTINTSELFELPKFILLITTSILITLCYLVDGITEKNWIIPHMRHPITLSVLVILITQILSTITSIHPYTSFWGYYSRFHQGLLTTICSTVLYLGILRYFDHKLVQKIIKVTVIGSTLLAIFAILEHFNISFTCPFINGA